MSHAKMEEGPAIPAAMPGTTKIPEPMVPPTPRLTSSTRPRDFRYEVSSFMTELSPGISIKRLEQYWDFPVMNTVVGSCRDWG
jgi:hypothetical protein